MSEPIHVLSLGAGVQSSTMALMAAAGEITPMPTAAIFADTQAEPASVYKWLDWLETQLPFPVYRVTAGNLEQEASRMRESQEGKHYVRGTVPMFVKNMDGSNGIRMRQCTRDYKIAPLKACAKRLIQENGTASAIQWIGISLDEVHRMKPSDVRNIEHRWPLIEMRCTRAQCLIWMEKNGYPKPPRSACVFCPYHNDHEWRRLRDEEPEEFARAIEFERRYVSADALSSHEKPKGLFLHDSRVPLDQVDFRTDEDKGQMSLFGNECEGMCGV